MPGRVTITHPLAMAPRGGSIASVSGVYASTRQAA